MLQLLLFTVFLTGGKLTVTATHTATATATATYGERCPGPNEHYSNCPDECIPKKCSELGFPIACPGVTVNGSCPSKPGCYCDPDYVRHDNGTCVLIKECPSCGGDPNAQNGCGNCPKTCKNYNSTEPQICLQYCNVNGCDCKQDYVLNEKTNKCIRPEQCNKCNSPYEHFEICPDDCEPRNCSQLGFPILCPATAYKVCGKPACLCDEGYKRDAEGKCIPTNKCPSCGGDKNAVSGCNGCPYTCQNIDSTKPQVCTKLCKRNSCICRPGFILDDIKNRCVCPTKCTPKCRPDEYLDPCANGGCHDARTCKELDILNGTSICVDPIKCIPGCLCKNGLLRNDKGECVPENECPNSKCKGEYETFVKCDINCLPEKCDQLGFPINCTILPPGKGCPGKPACLCRNGYVRDKYGKCIRKENCPSCGGDDKARAGCGNNCGRHCSDIGKPPVSCALSCIFNGCECKKGYYLDDIKEKCVLPEECTYVCGQNEKYTPCVQGGCVGAVNCSQITNGETVPVICKKIDPASCTPGCTCQDGYLRNKNGVCVLKDDCHINELCTGVNTFFDFCPPMCLSETCDSIRNPTGCPPQAAVCRPRCRCAQGYYKNDKGICVLAKDCNKCGKNEVFDKCVAKCPPRMCGTNDAAVLCAPTNPADCKAGCRCADGFYRNDKMQCVKWEDCPKCPKNEVYDPCPDPCPTQLCSVDASTIRCKAPPNLGDPDCKPGCRCVYGFKRTNDGDCVPEDQCPIICPGSNQIYDPCPGSCVYDCDDIIGKKYCQPQNTGCKGACVCKPGYVMNRIGQCVTIENCLKCGKNNDFFSCGGACDNVCASLSRQNQTHCPIRNIKCNDMCYCEIDHARDSNGYCIPISSCPKTLSKGSNSWLRKQLQ